MSTPDGRYSITYNGEIYNFRALRSELEILGHKFRSKTDTEVVLAAFAEWGTQCVVRFRGMFAFIIWDARDRRLFVARDRIGKKPLFYLHNDLEFLAASEIQGLLALDGVNRDVDLNAIDEYLSWGYVPAPKTAFKHISKLPPAHWLTVAADGRIRIERYWQLDYEPKSRLTLDEASEQLRALLTEAVDLRLISDVPLGVFLSGGIDSSIVAGLMAEVSSAPIKTFSIGFDEKQFNELEHARRIAQRWGTDHSEFIVRPDALEVLPLLVRHYGEPYADSSAIPTYYVSRMTRDHVTVALNGDGGDESFAGYDRYRANHLAHVIGRSPLSRGAASLLGPILPDSVDPKSSWRRARRFLEVATESQTARYMRWSSYFSPRDKARLYGRGTNGSGRDGSRAWFEDLFSSTQGLHPLDAAMSVDVRSYLPYDLLVKVDITTMANSLEGRSPFLDHKVMEFAARLPVAMKVHRGKGKYLLRREFSELLPRENVDRRKMGFGVPVGQWFRGPLRELISDAVASRDSCISAFLDIDETKRYLDAHLEERADNSAQLWSLLMLELWQRDVVRSRASI